MKIHRVVCEEESVGITFAKVGFILGTLVTVAGLMTAVGLFFGFFPEREIDELRNKSFQVIASGGLLALSMAFFGFSRPLLPSTARFNRIVRPRMYGINKAAMEFLRKSVEEDLKGIAKNILFSEATKDGPRYAADKQAFASLFRDAVKLGLISGKNGWGEYFPKDADGKQMTIIH